MEMVIDNILIPAEESNAQTWVTFYNKIEKKFGTLQAKKIFSYVFTVQGSSVIINEPVLAKMLVDKKIYLNSLKMGATIDATEKKRHKLLITLLIVSGIFILPVIIVLFRFFWRLNPSDLIGLGQTSIKVSGESASELAKMGDFLK